MYFKVYYAASYEENLNKFQILYTDYILYMK